MRNKILKTFITILFTNLFILLVSLHAQDAKTVKDKTDTSKQLNQIFRKEGWQIPKFDKSKIILEELRTIENQPVKLKKYKLPKAMKISIEYFNLKSDDVLEVHNTEVEIRDIFSYSINGRKFAYLVNVTLFNTTKEGSTIYMAAELQTYYFDEDGNGTFEMKYVNQEKFPKLPEWTKTLQKKTNLTKIMPLLLVSKVSKITNPAKN